MTLNKVHIALLAIVAGTLAVPTTAVADGWFSEMNKAKEVSLGDLLRSPRAYVDVDVKVKVYFHSTSENYNPYFTRFTEERFGNFAAWPYNARLYQKRDFERTYPLFFVERFGNNWKKLVKNESITALELHAVVREVFRGQPWIEVLGFRKLSGTLREADVRDVVVGDAHFRAGHYADAAARFHDAARRNAPDAVRADLNRRLADAQFYSGNYRDAAASYGKALRAAPRSAVLLRGLEASRKALAAAKAGAPAGDEKPAPHSEPVVADGSNDIDEIINVFEDAATVKTEVEQHEADLESRAAVVRAKAAARAQAEAVAVSVSDGGCGEQVEAAPEGEESTDESVTPEADGSDVEIEEGCGCGEETAEEADLEDEPKPDGDGEEGEPKVDEAEGCAEEAADETEADETEGCAEEAADETEAEDAEGCAEEAVDETTEAEEAEGCAEGTDGCAEEIVEDEGEAEEVAQPEDGCAPADDSEEATEETAEGDEAAEDETACGEGDVDVADMDQPEETDAAVEEDEASDDPRVVRVAGQNIRLPRLPFFGCDEVTLEQQRAVVEEVYRNPER